MNKIFYLFFITLFHFYVPSVHGQDQTALSNQFSSANEFYRPNKFEMNDEDEHYLKPAAFIIPGSFLIYSGLKPFIDDIGKSIIVLWLMSKKVTLIFTQMQRII